MGKRQRNAPSRIDIHSHILPGLDDGAGTMEHTLEMLRQLHKLGFNKCIATPHVMEGKYYLNPEQILATTEQVGREAIEAGIQVEILPGAENYIFPDLAKWLSEGKLLTLANNGQYLLVELPMTDVPHYTEQVWQDLKAAGVTPILAHPERNKVIAESPEVLLQWARRGVLFQINLLSVIGWYGPRTKHLAMRLLKNDLVDFIGSDIHRTSNAYREAIKRAERYIGKSKFEKISVCNPSKIF